MTNKIYIIFDLDETIGQFSQLGYFYQGITKYFNKLPSKKDFFILLDKYKYYFRPRIFDIFNYIKYHKKRHKNRLYILIFTNNQAGKKWITDIKDYIELKINYNLFDKIIGPYKIRNEIQEMLRSNHVKEYDDLVNFIECNDNTPIMFLDDKFHKGMLRDNIIYLLIEPYEFQYKIQDLINIYLNYNDDIHKEQFSKFITLFMSSKNYEITKSNILKKDYNMSDIILKHIHNFLTSKLKRKHFKKTVRKRIQRRNKTLKKQLYNYKL